MAVQSVRARQLGKPMRLYVSPTIARDYAERGVFPEFQGGGRGFAGEVPATTLNDVFEDASAQLQALEGVTARGRKIAYRVLQKAVCRSFGVPGHWARASDFDEKDAPIEGLIMSALETMAFMKQLGIPAYRPST